MKRVTGIGGIFFQGKDASALQAWRLSANDWCSRPQHEAGAEPFTLKHSNLVAMGTRAEAIYIKLTCSPRGICTSRS